MGTKSLVAAVIVAVLLGPLPVFAQGTGEVWRSFAQKLDAGSPLMVRLQNGQRFEAILIEARQDGLVLQPKTRRPVPVQPVAYDAIASLERYENKGPNLAKAIGIGAGVGAGTFLAILAILAASID